MKFILTHASRYAFTDDNGEMRRGCKLKGVDFTSRDDGDDKRGAVVIDKVSAPFEAYEQFVKDVPGVYELGLRTTVKKGELVQVFDSLQFISPLTAEALMGGKAPKASA